jgi:hypothetical protein
MHTFWPLVLLVSFAGMVGGQLFLDELARRRRRGEFDRFDRFRRTALRVYDRETVDALELVGDVLHARRALDELPDRAPLHLIRRTVEETIASEDAWEPVEEQTNRVCLRLGIARLDDRQIVTAAVVQRLLHDGAASIAGRRA